MAEIKIEGGRYLARCAHCGAWQEVRPEPAGAEAFFIHWRVFFTCCGRSQTALATEEKDEIDVH